MTYLPDTNTVSAYMRGDNPKFMAKMTAAFGEICLSVIVLAESLEPPRGQMPTLAQNWRSWPKPSQSSLPLR